jgi:hypothetical protein
VRVGGLRHEQLVIAAPGGTWTRKPSKHESIDGGSM